MEDIDAHPATIFCLTECMAVPIQTYGKKQMMEKGNCWANSVLIPIQESKSQNDLDILHDCYRPGWKWLRWYFAGSE